MLEPKMSVDQAAIRVWAAAARDAGHEEGDLLVRLMDLHDAFTAKASANNLAESLEGSIEMLVRRLIAKGVKGPQRIVSSIQPES